MRCRYITYMVSGKTFLELWNFDFVHLNSFLMTHKSTKNEFTKLIHEKKIKFPLKHYVKNQSKMLAV